MISPSAMWVGSMTLEYVNYAMRAPRTNSFTMLTFIDKLNLEIKVEVYPWHYYCYPTNIFKNIILPNIIA